jgi:hypothetical protein
MSKTYVCNPCKYTSINLSNYNKHLKTDKHLVKVPANIKIISKIEKVVSKYESRLSKKESKKEVLVKCEYCNKYISHKRNINRHYDNCKDKKTIEIEQLKNCVIEKIEKEQKEMLKQIETDKDDIIKKLKDDKQQLAKENFELARDKDEIVKEKDEIEKDFMDHLKQLANSKTTTTNQINISGDVNMNICYVIKNYTNAKNYEDLMAPALTRKELNYIKDRGPAIGREKIIMDRCVTNIKKEERPIQCVDYSRDKFALRTKGKWVPDWKGKLLLDVPSKMMRKIFNVQDTEVDITEIGNRVKLLMDMEHADKRTIRYLGKQTLLKK